jgi:U3 small nucleolar RNA-associated protein 14
MQTSIKVGAKHFRLEEVDEDDSIDDEGSEIGWNSDDEAAYGQLFNKKSSEGEEEEEDDEEMEGGMLLSDMLSSTSKPVMNQQPQEEEDDEELPSSGEEEEGGDSDSENEYAYDEDEDEGDHDKLLAAIEKYSKPNQQPTPAPRSNSKAFQLSTESPFSALQSNQTISLESLINSLENPTNSGSSLSAIDQETFKSMKTNLKSLNSSVTAPKYTHKVQSDRAERGVTYQQTSTDMKKWQELIRENQALKSLDLRQDKRSLPSTRSMITSFQPQTEMEKEIHMILLNPNSTTQHNELEIERNEEDELLHSKELTPEEMKLKQKELSKIKSLLFFEQMKRHRINKIKSKTFHRILKKKKLKKKMTSKEYQEMVQKLRRNGDLLEGDVDDEGDDDEEGGGGEKETEEEAIRRIKERMDLRHKNTGKWARMALEHGKGSKSLR